jgi:hypothetical protein
MIWVLGIITVVVIVLDELEVRQRRRCMESQMDPLYLESMKELDQEMRWWRK